MYSTRIFPQSDWFVPHRRWKLCVWTSFKWLTTLVKIGETEFRGSQQVPAIFFERGSIQRTAGFLEEHTFRRQFKGKSCLYSAYFMSCSSLKRSRMARVNEGSHSIICHPHVYPHMEWAMSAFTPLQLQSVTALWLHIMAACKPAGIDMAWRKNVTVTHVYTLHKITHKLYGYLFNLFDHFDVYFVYSGTTSFLCPGRRQSGVGIKRSLCLSVYLSVSLSVCRCILELFMVALCNRADHYIFALWFLSFFFLSSFFFSLA